MTAPDLHSLASVPVRGAWVSLWNPDNTGFPISFVEADPSPVATSFHLACHRHSCISLCHSA